jgi:polysaccharide biosynthesis protein PelE
MALDAAATAQPATGFKQPRRETIASIFAVAAEAIILALAASSRLPMTAALQFHLVVSVITTAILFYNRPAGEDLTLSALMALVLAVAGPAGALASLASLAFAGHAGAGPEVLSLWYDRLSNAADADLPTILTDRVMAGRVINTEAATPAQFEDVIATGTLEERQAALGLMARRFHPDFAPALEKALQSPEPVVRVQAAAVVARVRADLKTRIKTLVAPGEVGVGLHAPGHAIARAAELSRLAHCSLVDRADAEVCRNAAEAKLKEAISKRSNVLAASTRANTEAARLIESHLLSSGRFEDFRIARRIHKLIARGTYRVRFAARKAAA